MYLPNLDPWLRGAFENWLPYAAEVKKSDVVNAVAASLTLHCFLQLCTSPKGTVGSGSTGGKAFLACKRALGPNSSADLSRF